MKLEIAELWVEALRSGRYRQGTGMLRNRYNAFCCLGVLCNEHAKAHPEIAAKEKDTGFYLRHNSILPDQVKKWAGIETPTGLFEDKYGNNYELTSINDAGATFEDIAKLIEENADRL